MNSFSTNKLDEIITNKSTAVFSVSYSIQLKLLICVINHVFFTHNSNIFQIMFLKKKKQRMLLYPAPLRLNLVCNEILTNYRSYLFTINTIQNCHYWHFFSRFCLLLKKSINRSKYSPPVDNEKYTFIECLWKSKKITIFIN